MAPLSNLRQTTLFGGLSQAEAPQTQPEAVRKPNWPAANRDEPPTHHTLNRDALKTWVYPTNLGTIRDYQFNIVSTGLFHNLLVALPTGLGKTFIAATIMLNWFRWTKDAQIVFVAPTKPLVSQQVEACFKIVGIPSSETTLLTGQIAPGIRAQEWIAKRVFFMTPQTLMNDLKSGFADPKKIVLLVVDEAHRAKGSYAYVEVVTFMRCFNTSFRVLALTATPGASVEAVQEVIDGLGISRVEIRTEQSLDIRQYVHSRDVDSVKFDYSKDMVTIMDLFRKPLQPLVNQLRQQNVHWATDPMDLTMYGLNQSMRKWASSDAGRRANQGVKGMVFGLTGLLGGLAHSIGLLKFHGIGVFFSRMVQFRDETMHGDSKSQSRKQIVENEHFKEMMAMVQEWVRKPDFLGHPKLEYLQTVIMNHFLDAGEGKGAAAGVPNVKTRAMVFCHYRESAEELVRVLNRCGKLVRAHVFVGQANSKGSEGMAQKKQLEIIEMFKAGTYNTLVATSIGEEGLDIGEVDLIVCYDASASPIRMLQRMGRTGRKRAGNISVLLMKGKEENDFDKAKDNYQKMQKMIEEGSRFTFHQDLAPRIVPRGIEPEVDKRYIDIPVENTQAKLPEPKKGRGKVPKRPPKKFHMPDGVRTGFLKASKVDNDDDDDDDNDVIEFDEEITRRKPQKRVREAVVEVVPIPPLKSVFLSAEEEQDLIRTYQDVGGVTPQYVNPPRLDAFPQLQRTLRPTAHAPHGFATERMVTMLATMHAVKPETCTQYASNLLPEDMAMVDKQVRRRKAFLTGSAFPSSPQSGTAASPSPSQNSPRSSQPSSQLPSIARSAANLPARSKAPKRKPSRKQMSSISLNHTDNEDDEDPFDTGSLVDFIDDEVEPFVENENASSASSPPPSLRGSEKVGKLFYEPKFHYVPATQSDDELPNLSQLVGNGKRKDADDREGSELGAEKVSDDDELRSPPRRAKRRLVVDDSDDE
jgi:ATP-dependent DNA helicase MPH1